MTINKINIGGVKYAVYLKKNLIEPDSHQHVWGYTDYEKSAIYIENKLSEQHIKQTLIHELVHAMLWETGLLHAPLYLPVPAGGRGTAQGRRGTAAPHGADQAPEGPGPARPLSVRLHLCQRQRPKPIDGQGPRLCGELEGGI